MAEGAVQEDTERNGTVRSSEVPDSIAPESAAREHRVPDRVDIRHPAPGHAVLLVHGRLDALGAIELRARFAAECADTVQLVIDLGDARSLDVAGLAALVDAGRRCELRGGGVVLAGARAEGVRRMLGLSGLDRVLRLVELR